MLITYYHSMSSDQNNNLNSKSTYKDINIGDKAPDFGLLDTNQIVHSLSDTGSFCKYRYAGIFGGFKTHSI